MGMSVATGGDWRRLGASARRGVAGLAGRQVSVGGQRRAAAGSSRTASQSVVAGAPRTTHRSAMKLAVALLALCAALAPALAANKVVCYYDSRAYWREGEC